MKIALATVVFYITLLLLICTGGCVHKQVGLTMKGYGLQMGPSPTGGLLPVVALGKFEMIYKSNPTSTNPVYAAPQ